MRSKLVLAWVGLLGLTIGLGCGPLEDKSLDPFATFKGPADPQARFDELVDRYESSTFSALYRCGCQAREGVAAQMILTKSGSLTRYDDVYLVDDKRSGIATVGDGYQTMSVCNWSDGDVVATYDVSCTKPEESAQIIESLIRSATDVSFEYYSNALGLTSECFVINRSVDRFAVTNGDICFSDDGLPVFVSARVPANPPELQQRQYDVISLRPIPEGRMWWRQVIPDDRWPGESSVELEGVPGSDLSVPSLVPQLPKVE